VTFRLSYRQRPAVGQADSGPYQEPLLPQPDNAIFKNTYSSTSTPHIRLRRNTISCVLLFKMQVIVIFCAGEIINSVVISITHKHSGTEGHNLRKSKENAEN